jgi:hypothetical protein
MLAPLEKISALLTEEINLLWQAHHAVGLKGYMKLYTLDVQVPFRSKSPGIEFWFGPDETMDAVQQILHYYNQGILPNSTLLLNPVIHKKKAGAKAKYSNEEDVPDSYTPLGSGIIWATSLSLGVDVLNEESSDRLWELGVFASPFHRGDNEGAGLKIIAFCDEVQPALEDGRTVSGCKELYEIAHINSEQYASFYMLSAISYLTNNGSFQHPDFGAMFPKGAISDKETAKSLIEGSAINVQNVVDAAYCWKSYEHHHSLYKKFGTNPDDVETNLRFFNLVARDVELFDATGPMRKDAEEMFEFIVPGLIPRGAITLIGATGGTGKSSLAHMLSILASIDYDLGEEAPRWLGQRLAIEKCKGICVYFSGEDGPPIINARAAIYDPLGRAKRLMFQRTDFGEGVTFSQHMRRLHKIPDVPIMVIDPARKYLTGDENDAGVVSEFFEAIEEFAIEKHAAVVVVHHLQKGADPKSAPEVLDMLRGSQVFIDRPRVVIGMYRDGPYTVVGLAKNNIPPNLGMVTDERVFARDPKKLDLIWLPGHEGIRSNTLSPEELQKIAEEAKKSGH